jgi:predicted nuclease of predicted toxin-antitoxin system
VKIRLDGQLPPALAPWISTTFGVNCSAVRDLGLRDAEDQAIFDSARAASDVVILSKHSDFLEMLLRLGPPPQLLWLTCGNATNLRLKQLLAEVFPEALRWLAAGEAVVELGDRPETGQSGYPVSAE